MNLNLKNLKNKVYTFTPKVLYKNSGELPFDLLKRLQNYYSSSFFHLGNLDAFAEGIMVFMPAKYRFLERLLKKLPKEYEVHILFGFKTDTHDLLGIPSKPLVNKDSNERELLNNLKKFLEEYSKKEFQTPPKVSYKNLSSLKKLQTFKEKGVKALPVLSKKPVKMHSFKITKTYFINKKDLLLYIKSTSKKITKDYRQKDILEEYTSLYTSFPDKFFIVVLNVKVSSGFYVRALVRDLSENLKYSAVTYKIIRKSLGFWRI